MSIWISASETRNYALHDPLLDWLSYKEQLEGKTPPKISPFTSYIMKKGNEFEHLIANAIRQKFPLQFRQIINNENKKELNSEEGRERLYQETLSTMKEQVPIIYQGVLIDHERKVFGLPDFLIRVDQLKKIISNQPPIEERENHYIIVDCKWSTLHFCVNGFQLRNEGSMPAYKTQLAVYQYCLERIQPNSEGKALLLGKRWKGANNQIVDSCFDKFGIIDYKGKDRKFQTLAMEAIEWLHTVRREGSTWKLYPHPSRKELYPNMKNHHDDPWHKIKEEIAERLGEITQIWNCKYINRENCLKQNINTWRDLRCNIETLGIKGERIGPVITQILEVNRDSNCEILPRRLPPQYPREWLEWRRGDFYLDFEFVAMIDNSFQPFPMSKVEGMVYLIGVGGLDQHNQWYYRSFLVDRLCQEQEIKIFQAWISFIEQEAKKLKIEKPRLFHWGNAENTWFVKYLAKIPEGIRRSFKFEMINLLDKVKEVPITVKGAFGFGLKELGKALYRLKKINLNWQENETLNVINQILTLQEEAYNKGINIGQCEGISSLLEYNEIDCKMMYEILKVLRTHYEEETNEVGDKRRTHPMILRAPKRSKVVTDVDSIISTSKDVTLDDINPTNNEESEPDELLEIWEGLDHLEITELVKMINEGKIKLSRFQREHFNNYLRRLLGSFDSDKYAYRQYLLYYLQQSSFFQKESYEHINDREIQQLERIKELAKSNCPEPNKILSSALPLMEKQRLFERYVALQNLIPFSEEWFKLRNEINSTLTDSSNINERQLEILDNLPTVNDNYLARIADSSLSTEIKALLVKKYRYAMSQKEDSTERATEFQILNHALALPGNNLESSSSGQSLDQKLIDAKRYLDEKIYGMKTIKQEFLLYILEVYQGKNSSSNIIGLSGAPGIGKSTFVHFLAQAFQRNVYTINMGGISDVTMLTGNLPCYVGSDIGLLAQALIKTKQQNCIIVLEEIDKISDTPAGSEISKLLVHLLDPNFNDNIIDKFLGIPLSFRNVLFVVTMNEENKISPILLNRLRLFRIPNPSLKDRIGTCRNIIIPRLMVNYGFHPGDINFDEEALIQIIHRNYEDKGLRTAEKTLTSLFRRLFSLKVLHTDTIKLIFDANINLTFPLNIDTKILDRLLVAEENEDNDDIWKQMIM